MKKFQKDTIDAFNNVAKELDLQNSRLRRIEQSHAGDSLRYGSIAELLRRILERLDTTERFEALRVRSDESNQAAIALQAALFALNQPKVSNVNRNKRHVNQGKKAKENANA